MSPLAWVRIENALYRAGGRADDEAVQAAVVRLRAAQVPVIRDRGKWRVQADHPATLEWLASLEQQAPAARQAPPPAEQPPPAKQAPPWSAAPARPDRETAAKMARVAADQRESVQRYGY